MSRRPDPHSASTKSRSFANGSPIFPSHYFRWISERIEPSHQILLAFPSRRFRRTTTHPFKCLALGFQIGLCVEIGRLWIFVPKQILDHCQVDTGSYQVNSSRVPE